MIFDFMLKEAAVLSALGWPDMALKLKRKYVTGNYERNMSFSSNIGLLSPNFVMAYFEYQIVVNMIFS